MLSDTNFFLGGGQNGRTSQTTWPSPFDRVVTESRKKSFSPIIDTNLKEKQNNNFFHQLFFFMLSDTNFFLGGGQNGRTSQTTWPSPFDRLVTELRKKSSGPIIDANLKEKQNKFFFHQLFFFMLSDTNFFLGGGQNGRTSQTTWPSPFDRLVTESRKKSFGPIIDANLKEKQNKKFFHQLLFSTFISGGQTDGQTDISWYSTCVIICHRSPNISKSSSILRARTARAFSLVSVLIWKKNEEIKNPRTPEAQLNK